MSLLAGTVTVASDLSRTGTGLALGYYDARVGSLMPVAEDMDPGDAQTMLQALGDQCVDEATALVGHVTANAEVTVTVATGDAGLQRTPNPNLADTATQGPSAPVVLATSGTVA